MYFATNLWGVTNYLYPVVRATDVSQSISCNIWVCDTEPGWNCGVGSESATIDAHPTGEDTSSIGWYVGETQHQFEMTLTGRGPFTGRRVREYDAGGGYDQCWFQGGPVDEKLDAVTGGSWPVGSGNTWGPNKVGWGSIYVGRYRRYPERLPCGCLMVQGMEINTSDGNWYWYTTNELRARITATDVIVSRDGVERSKAW